MPVLISTVWASSHWQRLCFSAPVALRQSKSLLASNTLKKSLSLIGMSVVLPMLWQLPVQGEATVEQSSIPQPSEPEQRRIVIENSAHYQFTDLSSGIEHLGESQTVLIRRRQPLDSQPQDQTDESTASDNANSDAESPTE